MLIVLQPCGPPSPSFSSVWDPGDPFGSRHPAGGGPSLAVAGAGGGVCPRAPCPGSPAPLGLSRPLRPVRLVYSPGLMRAFNFSFTTSVTPTFNNTPCARQKFAPGNHGFDHKTTAGRRSWLTLSALRAVCRQCSWKSDAVSPLGLWLGGSGPLPGPGRRSPRLWGRRRVPARRGPGLWARGG